MATTSAGTLSSKLAAILHADIVGYSRLSRQDELGTHLDHGPIVELAGPDPSADAVTPLQDDYLGARPAELVGRDQAREPGPDDGGPHAPVR